MKKAIALPIACLLLMLAACSGDKTVTPTETLPPTATPILQTPTPTAAPADPDAFGGDIHIARNTRGENLYASDGVRILAVTVSVPKIEDDTYPDAAAVINSYYQSQQDKHIQYAETELYEYAIYGYTNSMGGSDFSPYTSEQFFTLGLNEKGYLSFCRYMVETSGDHEEDYMISETFEASTGGLVTGSYLYSCGEDEFKTRITDAIVAQIDAQGGEGYYENYAQLVKSAFIPDCYYLTPDGIVYYFQTYELAGAEKGQPAFVIPYGDVADIFRLW